MASSYNRVPEGRVGTGEAYVLPQSEAVDSLIDTIAYNQKMGLLNVKAQRDTQNAVAKSYMDNQLKAKNGYLFNSELKSYLQKHIEKGAGYRAKGFDVYNPDPNKPDQVSAYEDYMKERAQLQSMMDLRDEHEKHYLDQLKEAQKGGYDEDSVNALNDFYKDNGRRLYELQESGASLPMLAKSFDANAHLKNVKASSIKQNTINGNEEVTTVAPNMAAIRYGVEQSFMNSPQAQRWLSKQVGKSPVPVLGTQNPEQVTQYLADYYTSPEGAEEVVKNLPPGTVPSRNSPEFKEFINRKAAEQIGAEKRYSSVMDQLTKQKASEVNQQMIKDLNFDRENQQMKRASHAMSVEAHGRKKKDWLEKDDELNRRDEWIQGLQAGSNDYVQRLRDIITTKDNQGSVGYFTSGPNEGKMRIKYREMQGGKFVQREHIIDPEQLTDQSYSGFNEVLNYVSGKKIPVETLLNKPSYTGSLVNVGKYGFDKDQIQQIRDRYGKDHQSLGDFFVQKGVFKTKKEAYEKAAEILDKKGKIHIMK